MTILPERPREKVSRKAFLKIATSFLVAGGSSLLVRALSFSENGKAAASTSPLPPSEPVKVVPDDSNCLPDARLIEMKPQQAVPEQITTYLQVEIYQPNDGFKGRNRQYCPPIRFSRDAVAFGNPNFQGQPIGMVEKGKVRVIGHAGDGSIVTSYFVETVDRRKFWVSAAAFVHPEYFIVPPSISSDDGRMRFD